VAARLSPSIEAVVFDIGGVLLDWNPRHLYRKLFDDEQQMERFLAEVCTLRWHAAHDRGVPLEQSCVALAAAHPGQQELILAWHRRSEEMEAGEIQGSIEILAELLAAGIPCYALTNMERETYPRRLRRYPFMSWFHGTVVSYQEGTTKPQREIFERLLARFSLRAEATVMIDDSEANLQTAAGLGMKAVHFHTPTQLRDSLAQLGLGLALEQRAQHQPDTEHEQPGGEQALDQATADALGEPRTELSPDHHAH
jgi:2-haloacid dehalogenase